MLLQSDVRIFPAIKNVKTKNLRNIIIINLKYKNSRSWKIINRMPIRKRNKNYETKIREAHKKEIKQENGIGNLSNG